MLKPKEPRLYYGKKDIVLSVKLSQYEHALLSVTAESEGITLAACMRKAFHEYSYNRDCDIEVDVPGLTCKLSKPAARQLVYNLKCQLDDNTQEDDEI
jgi:hypothetical protein